MVITIASLTTQTRILSVAIARLAFVVLGLQHLARCLMLELVVLAQEPGAKRTIENAATVLVHRSFAFDANRIL